MRLLPVLLMMAACGNPAKPLLEVEATARWTLPTLSDDAHVIFTDGGVPHIYAKNRRDLAVVWGFQLARDRYFIMDLSRRLALGELSEVLGEDALEADMESRAEGNRVIAENMLTLIETHHPDILEVVDGYAEGVNAYLDAVKAGTLPPPSEYDFAAGTLNADDALDLMTPFDRLDVIAGAATVLAMSGFESGDVGRGYTIDRLDDWYRDFDQSELRQAGLRPDLWDRVEPVFNVASAPEWDPIAHPRQTIGVPGMDLPAVPWEPVERILKRRARWDHIRGHDWEHGWGSNAWAVSAEGSATGNALLAGDGHLALTIPPLFYQIGLNTELLSKGKDELAFTGMAIPGVPVPGPGTNGDVSWGQIAFFGDVTDWYREEIQLDDKGVPKAARFRGEWVPLVAVQETANIREVPLLNSEGGTITWTRWTTADGKWIADIEGRRLSDGEPGDGESAVWMGGDQIVPSDTDGDNVITGISFDYTPLEGSPAVVGLWGFADATTVDEFRDSTKDLVGNAAGLIAADSQGDILYTGFQAVPCRTQLERNPDGSWAEGSDPRLLLDGTRHGGFKVPLTADGHVDLSAPLDDPGCLVPFDGYPWSKNPAQQFLVAANNDPGGQTFDNDLHNDGWYVGGPWLEGYRADTISRELTAQIADGGATIQGMQDLQANHDSRLGEQFWPPLLEALDRAETISSTDGPRTPTEQRLADLWDADADRLTEVRDRLTGWSDRGFQARSGVETFYNDVQGDDLDDSVATMIFNAWYGRFLRSVIDDEQIPSGTFAPTGDSGRQRVIKRFLLEGRGADNPAGLASFNEETGESIYFDIDGTEVVETSDELMIAAVTGALDFLESPATGPGEGGFGTPEMDKWLWGLRHMVRFESVIAEFLGDDPTFASLAEGFSITPKRVAVAEGLAPNDPRRNLPGFPRHGDHLNVDAGNSGTNGQRFTYGAGPVFRFVVEMNPEQNQGENVLPGGNSGIADSENFDDQAKLWLGNQALPLHTSVEDVVGNAVTREAFVPK
ncbi:MAG: penicillin acylase family protein [Myxococcota bacterium]